jgi:flavodoxin/Pyruvate/2-oxoacid:ferredoxin oxidoreductase delta subunit
MKTTIYYFSGTGNSLKVAKDIATELEDTETIKICKDNIDIHKTISKKIGFVFPVYYSGMPLLVKAFIENLKIPSDAYVFTIVTFGRSSDASIPQLEKLLKAKGSKLSAAFKIKMPGNYQIMYAPHSDKEHEERFKNEEEKIPQIARSINNNEIVKFRGVGESLKTVIGGMISSSFKPYKKDKDFWADEKCNGCSICSKVCPANNIKMVDAKPQWKNECEQCLACMQWCPKKSIQYKKVTVDRGRYHHPDVKVNELVHLRNK